MVTVSHLFTGRRNERRTVSLSESGVIRDAIPATTFDTLDALD